MDVKLFAVSFVRSRLIRSIFLEFGIKKYLCNVLLVPGVFHTMD